MNYNSYKDALIQICKEVGAFQLKHFSSVNAREIRDKGLNQLVSFVDVESEKMLVTALRKMLPEAGFITEEETTTTDKTATLQWIIDPLDGTTNYLHGLPAFSISVALMAGDDIVLGVVHIPAWQETFYACKDQGAFLNGNRIICTEQSELSSALIATGFPYYDFEQMQPYIQTLQDLMQHTHGLRRMGSAAIDLAYTACGRFDGFFELGLHAWDVAAGVLLVKEAGGKVSDFNGGEDYLFGDSIIACGTKIYPTFFQTIQKYF